jgi:hypothetical protein
MAVGQGRALALAVAFMCAATGCSRHDAELARGLGGVWQTSAPRDIVVVIDYRPGHVSYYTWRSASNGKKVTANGTWSIKNGVLVETIQKWSLPDQAPPTTRAEILSVKADELIMRGEPGKGPDVLRRLSVTEDGNATSLAENASNASAPPTPEPAPSATTPAPAAVPPAPAPEPAPATSPQAFIDETVYVPSKEHAHLNFDVKRKATVLMLVDIDNQVPVDIVLLPAQLSAQHFENLKMNIGIGEASDMMSQLFGSEVTEQYLPKNTSGINENTLFTFPLSKRGAYGHFEARAELAPGAYTLFLDNTEDFTPTRGDAPVHVRMYAQ